ncbi:protein-(glutamine-N5) methyltransferase, release factor-specific [Flavobacterium cyanobacteriorum]|uniref:Release factor glutamine methyltransferase n=1 Tax=Flavobacterium cyanobacteriorum TaxID=2022802 RepID=A0A255ZA29_9FLAO|nr:peptide chain release factor N(5)-glutamine methyltransferase [Flavobacterium cyanobacteriorum]OYQ37754.1 protein-(glutamine-N5) methyltransferase, release factor-specific [Flavobacterium cyanobacteriorum]
MKIRDYRSHFLRELTPLYDAMEAESFFIIALAELKGWKRTDLALNPDAEFSEAETREWDVVLAQLQKQVPIQYIFNKAYFYGLEFEVNRHTLIPRPETEELVAWVINDNKAKGNSSILDIGTGSGCIAVSLAKNLPRATVSALDVSEEALAVAIRNATQNDTVVAFRQMDILTVEALPQQYDCIVSNPPYVRVLEKGQMKRNVLEYEPHLALFVEDNDALLFYRKIALLAKQALNKNGTLYFEINQYLGKETAEMLEGYGYTNIILKKDIYGNDRMIASRLA